MTGSNFIDILTMYQSLLKLLLNAFFMNNISQNRLLIALSTCLIFIFCISNGFRLAQKKLLWYDELFGQIRSVQRFSLGQIIKGDYINHHEANNSPMFYLIQKGISSLFNYKISLSQWFGPSLSSEIQSVFKIDLDNIYNIREDSIDPKILNANQKNFIMNRRLDLLNSHVKDPRGQIILRINPVIFMSLAATLIFSYFSLNYSVSWGIYSFILIFSSNMFWGHWCEARPYALWFFLTTVQSLLLIILTKDEKIKLPTWNLLIITHFLLSLTVIVSVSQILIASIILWAFKEKNLRRYIFLTALPVLICFYYYSYTIYGPYTLSNNVLDLILTNSPREQLLIIFIFSCYLFLNRLDRFKKFSPQENIFKASKEYLCLVILMLLSALFLLLFFKIHSTLGMPGFIYPRYFIYLTPVAIIGTTLFSINLYQLSQKNKTLKITVAAILIFLLSEQFLTLHAKYFLKLISFYGS